MKKIFFACLVLMFAVQSTVAMEVNPTAQHNVTKEQKAVDDAIAGQKEVFNLPEDMGNGVWLVNVERKGNFVVYTCMLDERFGDFYDFKAIMMKNISGFKDMIRNDAETNLFCSFIKSKGMGVKYKFVGSETSLSFELTFNSDEY